MGGAERLELVIEVNADAGNKEIRTVNTSLSSLERQALNTSKIWGGGMDGMAASAAKAMQRSSQEMYEARQAAQLLGRQIGVQLPEAVSAFMAKASGMGTLLSSVFKVSIYAAIGTAIWDIGKGIYKWATATKEVDEATKRYNETLDKTYAKVIELRKAGALIGLSGSVRSQAEGLQSQAAAEAVRARLSGLKATQSAAEALASRVQVQGAWTFGQGGMTPEEIRAARAAREALPGINAQIRTAEVELLRIETERTNIARQFAAAREDEAAAATKLAKEAYDKQTDQMAAALKKQFDLRTETEEWAKILDVVSTGWKNITYGIEDAAEKQAKLLADLSEVQPRMALSTGRPGTDYGKVLEPMDPASRAQRQIAQASNQVSTIVTDWSAALARAALDVRNFGSIIVSAARSTAEMLIRTFLEGSLSRAGIGAAIPAGIGGGGLGIPGVGGGGGGAGAGGAGSSMGFGALGANLKSFVGFGGGIPASFGGKLSAIGKSNAAMMGGSMLAMYGLKRGGVSGMAMSTAGGALTGYGIGAMFGPHGAAIGAAIGAGVGLVSGLIRMFVKGATEKARQKIKAAYGVDIQDKGVLGQIVDMAKQAFGGNLDMAIRSQAVRDLVELYAMSTGQGTSGMPAKMTSLSLTQSGGSIYQQGGLPGAGIGGTGGAFSINISRAPINITAPDAAALKGEITDILERSDREIQNATKRAMKKNYQRRELTALQVSPGALTS